MLGNKLIPICYLQKLQQGPETESSSSEVEDEEVTDAVTEQQ